MPYPGFFSACITLTNNLWRDYMACTGVVILLIVVIELTDADLFNGSRLLYKLIIAEIDPDIIGYVLIVNAKEH